MLIDSFFFFVSIKYLHINFYDTKKEVEYKKYIREKENKVTKCSI